MKNERSKKVAITLKGMKPYVIAILVTR